MSTEVSIAPAVTQTIERANTVAAATEYLLWSNQ
jgi:hypothetical protein